MEYEKSKIDKEQKRLGSNYRMADSFTYNIKTKNKNPFNTNLNDPFSKYETDHRSYQYTGSINESNTVNLVQDRTQNMLLNKDIHQYNDGGVHTCMTKPEFIPQRNLELSTYSNITSNDRDKELHQLVQDTRITTKKTKIFVYGTFLKGCNEHYILEKPGVKFLGNVQTLHKHALFVCGVPMLHPGDSQCIGMKRTRILGEIYEINLDLLKVLDNMSGHPNWLQRRLIKVEMLPQNMQNDSSLTQSQQQAKKKSQEDWQDEPEELEQLEVYCYSNNKVTDQQSKNTLQNHLYQDSLIGQFIPSGSYKDANKLMKSSAFGLQSKLFDKF